MANSHKKRANTIGSITYIKSRNIYQGRIFLGYDENGKQKRKAVYGKTEDEVARKMIEYKYLGDEQTKLSDNKDESTQNHNIKNKNIQSKSNSDSDETIYTLINSIVSRKLGLNIIQETTSYRTLDTLKMIKKIYDIPIQLVDENILLAYFNYITKYSKSVIEKICIMINQAFKEAMRLQIISVNPMDYLLKPKSKVPPKRIRALSIEEEKKFIKVLTNEDIMYSQQLLISLFTGMRMGEINALHVEDIDMNKNIIHINKTISKGKAGEAILHNNPKTEAGMRDIPLPLEIKGIFEEMFKIRQNGPIFLCKGKLINTAQVYSGLRRAVTKFDIIDHSIRGTVSVHSCRHTYATRCIEGGMQPKVLQNLLGHTDITITMNTYCEAFDKYREESIKAAEIYFKNVGITLN